MIPSKSIILCLCIFLFTTVFYGHNGKIAFAYPMDKITVDGKISDWPTYIERFEITNFLGASGDTKAFFRVGYNLDKQALYIAVEVLDDSNIKSNANSDIWWNPEDKQILYLDFDHNPDRGSGVIGIAASQSGFVVRKANNNWDPFNSLLSKDDIEVKVKHSKRLTIYEWKIQLGDAIKSNKSIGLDFLITDVDANTESTNSLVWSPGGSKIAMPFRLGDIMLLEKDVKRGHLEGIISWNGNPGLSLPQKVKIVSEKSHLLWAVVEVDSVGHYKTELPQGTYRISSASKNVNIINVSSI